MISACQDLPLTPLSEDGSFRFPPDSSWKRGLRGVLFVNYENIARLFSFSEGVLWTTGKRVILIAIVLITANFSIAYGQNTPDSLGTLTLKESINIAQKNSPIAQSYQFDLLASRWQYKQYHATLLPSLVLKGNAPNYSQNIFPHIGPNGTTNFVHQQQSNANVSLGIQQRILPTGGTIFLSTGLNRLGIFRGEGTYLWKSQPIQVRLSQPLFQFNRLKWRHKIEPLQYTIAKKQFNQNMENLALQITNAFFDVVLSKINKQDAKLNVARNDSIYKLSQGRYNVGKIAKNDLLQTKLEFHQAQESLSKAKINYQRNLNRLKILLGYPTSVKLELSIPKDLPKVSVNITKAQRLALKNNSQSLSHQLNKLQADRSLAQAKSEGGFQATLSASFGLNKRASQFANLYEHPSSQKFFSLDFNMPIFDWGKHRAQIQAAKNQQRSTTNNVQFEQQQFLQSVRYRVINFLQLRNQAQLAAESKRIARQRYQVSVNRYSIGKISITDLFLAQGDKDSARQGYISALRDFWTGWYNLRKLTLYNFRKDKPIEHTLSLQ